jgi:hypothetical protein
MAALRYDDPAYLRDEIKLAAGVKDQYLTWAEFLDFFFLRDAPMHDRMDGNDWWNHVDDNGKYRKKDLTEELLSDGDKVLSGPTSPNNNKKKTTGSQLTAMQQRDLLDKAPVRMTGQLDMLVESRHNQTEREVEDEFKDKLAETKGKKEKSPR